MSALVFKLLLHLCVWSRIVQANGIQNLRYPARFDKNQWRFSKRQDFSTKSRFLIWKPPINPGQIYSHVKTPIIPLNYNRYSIQSPPIMAPIHHNYMFAIPTKVNFASYQPLKEIEDNRKPGNLHHLTIINSIMPKPYLPTAPTIIHSTTPFQIYRRNNKQLYHQYVNNFGRQNMENFNKINTQQFQLQKHHQHLQQQQALQMILTSSPSALQTNKPTIEYMNVKNYKTGSNNIEQGGNEINSPISQCDRKVRNDTNYSASNVLYYYCNNRITNYKNPTQEQIIGIQPTTSTSSSTTTTTTTTTEVPFTTPAKIFRNDFNIYTTEKPIFLPTPVAPLENSFMPITSTSILKNSLPDSTGSSDNFKLQNQKHKQKKFGYQPQSSLWYDDMKSHQQYTTAAVYDNVKLHSFFTIEDAVTRSPDMQVFNDPYQAYKHARKQKINNQRQTSFTTKTPDNRITTLKPKFTNFFSDLDNEENAAVNGHARRQEFIHRPRIFTSTKMPDTTTTTTKPKFKSFFDDLDDEDYIIPEAHQYDYSLFSSPQKTAYHKTEFKNALLFPKHNQIMEHRHKANEEKEFIAVGETIVGRPKIKEHHFGLFDSLASTAYTLPAVSTHKQISNFNQLISTTHKIPFPSSYKTKPMAYTTTLHTVLGNIGSINEQENSTPFLNDILTTTPIPIATTTEKKSVKITIKPPLNLKSSTAFKYLKQRRIHKSYTNLTSTTTKAPTLLKKVPKYQRQYKTKKIKQFKHLYTTTTSTTSTSTTTTEIPTTEDNYITKRTSARLLTTSTTEEPTTTKKSISSRSSSTAEIPKQESYTRGQAISTTEATKTKHIKIRTATATIITVNNPPTKVRSTRRGTKRANIAKNENETPEVVRKVNNKKRRRLTSSSTTPKPLNNRTISGSTSTSVYSSTPIPVNIRTSTTTTKSIMRISNSKPRIKVYKDVKLPLKTPNEMDGRKNSEGRNSLKSISSTMANVPPLPIEIYFRKSHNVKI